MNPSMVLSSRCPANSAIGQQRDPSFEVFSVPLRRYVAAAHDQTDGLPGQSSAKRSQQRRGGSSTSRFDGKLGAPEKQRERFAHGIITHQQLSPGNDPGSGTLTVTGEDVSVMMDLEEKKAEG